MIEIALALICSSILFVLIKLLLSLRLRAGIMKQIIVGLTVIHEAVLVIFPVIYSIFTNFALEQEMYLGPEELLTVMIGEIIFVTAFAIGMSKRLVTRDGRHNRIPDDNDESASRNSVFLFFTLLTLMGLLFWLSSLISPNVIGSEYADVLEKGTGSVSIFQQLFEFLNHLYWWPSLIAPVFLLLFSDLKHDSPVVTELAKIVAGAVVVMVLVFSLTTAVRGRLVWIASLLFIGAYLTKRRKLMLVSVIMLSIGAMLMPFFGGGQRGLRNSLTLATQAGFTRMQLLELVIDQLQSGKAFQFTATETLGALVERAQAVRNSIILYRLQDQGKGLGFFHYSAALLPVPKMFWPDKPIVGSCDGTVWGRAMFLVQTVGRGLFTEMGPILASAHAYWEGGWLWVPIAGLILGLMLNFYVSICEKVDGVTGYLFALLPMGALIVDGLLTANIPLHHILQSFWLTTVSTYLLYKLVITQCNN